MNLDHNPKIKQVFFLSFAILEEKNPIRSNNA